MYIVLLLNYSDMLKGFPIVFVHPISLRVGYLTATPIFIAVQFNNSKIYSV